MKRILKENYSPFIQHHCKKCKTLFEYQEEDIEVSEDMEDDGWNIEVITTSYITCPKCEEKHILSIVHEHL